MTDLACVFCKNMAYAILDGDSVCYEHYKKRWSVKYGYSAGAIIEQDERVKELLAKKDLK